MSLSYATQMAPAAHTRAVNSMIGALRSTSVGLDLGTANTLVWVKGLGVALKEPSCVTVHANSGRIECAGSEAEATVGRTPANLKAVRPIRRGTICDLDLCGAMLRRFLERALASSSFRRARVAIATPGELTEVERLAMAECLRGTVAAEVMLVDQVHAAAQGAGLAIEEARGRMVVNIGAGVTDVAVLSLASVVTARTIPVAGDELDAAICNHVRAEHQLLIGEHTAERIKIEVGSALAEASEARITVKGRCLVHGVPRELELRGNAISEAMQPIVKQIAGAIRAVLEEVPAELSADLVETGILLTGGSALLRNLDVRIAREFGLPVQIAPDPMTSVIRGLGQQIRGIRKKDWQRFSYAR